MFMFSYTAFIYCSSYQNIFTGQEKQFWANNIEEKASKLSSSECSHKNKQYNQMPTQPQTNQQK